MSKYQLLWEFVQHADQNELVLSFAQIESMLGFPIDHAFLMFKKEVTALGFAVKKISLKNKTVTFVKQS